MDIETSIKVTALKTQLLELRTKTLAANARTRDIVSKIETTKERLEREAAAPPAPKPHPPAFDPNRIIQRGYETYIRPEDRESCEASGEYRLIGQMTVSPGKIWYEVEKVS